MLLCTRVCLYKAFLISVGIQLATDGTGTPSIPCVGVALAIPLEGVAALQAVAHLHSTPMQPLVSARRLRVEFGWAQTAHIRHVNCMCALVFRKLTPPGKSRAAHWACAGLFIEVQTLMLDETPLFNILPPTNGEGEMLLPAMVDPMLPHTAFADKDSYKCHAPAGQLHSFRPLLMKIL